MFGYFDALLRYFELSGRTTRTQYWVFQLCMVVLIVGAVWADYQITGRLPERDHFGFLTMFVVIFHVVPGITVTVRRLHDSGRSGWWYLLNLVPFGGIVVLVFMCLGPNEDAEFYGEDPRFASGDAPVAKARPVKNSAAQQMLAQMEARRAAGRLKI